MKRYYNGQIVYIKGPDDHKALKIVLAVAATLVVAVIGICMGLGVIGGDDNGGDHGKVYVSNEDDKDNDKDGSLDWLFSKDNTEHTTESTEVAKEPETRESTEAVKEPETTESTEAVKEPETTESTEAVKEPETTETVQDKEEIYADDLRYKKGLLHTQAKPWKSPDSCADMKEFAHIFDEYILSGSQEKLVIHTAGLNNKDIKDVNKFLTQPFAFVDTTLCKTSLGGGTDITVEAEYDDAYYVYAYIVYGIPIPDDNDRARKIYNAVCDMFKQQDISAMSDYEKELFYHDYITDISVYDEASVNANSRSDAHSVYGLMVNNLCVCEGYARTMGLLLSISGIDNYYVSGNVTESTFTGDGGHAWNIVSIGGKWYHLDATWDDPVGDRITDEYHTYFNVSDDVMRASRNWDESLFPSCNSMDDNYYKRTGAYLSSYDDFMSYAESELDQMGGTGTVVVAVADYDAGVYDIDAIHRQIYPQLGMTYNFNDVAQGYAIIVLKY